MADATVSGRVYADSNSNGVLIQSRDGLEGFTVFSDTDGDSNGLKQFSVQTDADVLFPAVADRYINSSNCHPLLISKPSSDPASHSLDLRVGNMLRIKIF